MTVAATFSTVGNYCPKRPKRPARTRVKFHPWSAESSQPGGDLPNCQRAEGDDEGAKVQESKCVKAGRVRARCLKGDSGASPLAASAIRPAGDNRRERGESQGKILIETGGRLYQ
jgi:hypothetical protein